MSFELTERKVLLNIWLSAGAAGLSFVLCLSVLIAAVYIYTCRAARPVVDRVSFRLFLWSMVFEAAYGIAYVLVEVYSAEPGQFRGWCAAGVYWMAATLGTVNYLCTCIAINLMLAICFDINPVAKHLERWYIGVSIALGMGVPVLPAALGHFGYDPILNVCWITAGNDRVRMKYFVLDLYLGQILSCCVATGAVVMTLFTLFQAKRRTFSAIRDSSELNQDVVNGFLSYGEHPMGTRNLGHLQTQFMRIALTISTYPISLIVVNVIITVGDLYISKEGGVKSRAVYALYCVYYFLYGGRGIVFASLGIFVDPCLRRGVKAAWRLRHRKEQDVEEVVHDLEKQSFMQMLGSGAPVLLATPVQSSEKLDIDGRLSVELVQALNTLPIQATQPRAPSPQRTLSKTFSGVRPEDLPEGLTDAVDVDLRRKQSLDEVNLEPLTPDLPDQEEERNRRWRANQVDREEATRLFQETRAQL